LTKEKAAITNCLSNDLDLSEDGVARAKKKEGGNQIDLQCKRWIN